jgi:hypothetical protein
MDLSTIVLNDGTNDHTFTPRGISNGVAKLWDNTAGVASVAPVFKISSSEGPSNVNVRIKMEIPLQGTDADGRTVSVGTTSFDGIFKLPLQSSLSERVLTRQLAAAILAHATSVSLVDNLEGIS